MGILQLKPSFKGGSGYAAIAMPSPPGWADNDVNTKSKWYYSSQDNAFFLYHLEKNKKFYVQVGMNRNDFASARFVTETYDILNEHLNEDGSVSADIKITLSPLSGRRTDYAGGGVSVKMTMYFGDTVIGGYTGNTANPVDVGSNPNPITVHVKLGPQETAENTQLKLHYEYPNGEYTNSTMTLGGAIYNPTLPNYVPMAIRKSNNWKSLNKNHGFITIRKEGTWQDKSKENKNTERQANQGHNRIRRSSSWLQLPPME